MIQICLDVLALLILRSLRLLCVGELRKVELSGLHHFDFLSTAIVSIVIL